MIKSEIATDVLIVGAGPVGLFLANECARRGLRWRIVEANASQSVHSKALAIFPRTLEILDMAGVSGPFLARANRVNSVAVVSHERALARIPFAPKESPYPFVAMVPQDVTERLLVEQLQGAGGAVEYETTFVSAVEQDDHLCITLNRKGIPLELRASFVVGCDGAHSSVRHLLNLPFAGKQYDASFMDALTKAMATPNRLAQKLRDALIPAVSQFAAFQHAFVMRLSGLGIAYPRSPIVEGAGNRYFDASLRGGTRIGSRFLLLSNSDGDCVMGDAARHFMESFGDVVEQRIAQGDRTVLLRPDGYVACAVRTRNETAALAVIRSVLERQIRQSSVTSHRPAASCG